MRHATGLLLLLPSLLLAGCDDGAGDDAGVEGDAGRLGDGGGASMDAGDGASDAGEPASDAGDVDAGPPVDPLEGIGAVEMVRAGFQFLEGPHWREADGVLLFTDIPAGIIYELTPPSTVASLRTRAARRTGSRASPTVASSPRSTATGASA